MIMKDSPINKYLENINKRFKLGNATEHTYRGDLQQLIESIVPTIRATNEPKRQKCGAPDYILTRKDVPIGFIESKDIGDNDLDGIKKTGHKEQFDRYKASLSNLIFTDFLDFHLYREGQFITNIQIGKITDKGIVPLYNNFESFHNLINDFCLYTGQTIKSSKKLAQMMAGKARLLADAIGKALTSDEDNSEDSTLKDQMQAFKKVLIHDIEPEGFADIYAQTITYGLFAARLRDPSLKTFSRQEAYELIPKSNPFLKKLFGYIAGLDIDDRMKWIVDDLITIFMACNVANMLKNYGKTTHTEDPIIHFYEDFLSEYDPEIRETRGVWYTPAPVVSFIVRAVDDILKSEFDLPQGLVDTSTTKIKVDAQGKKIEQEVHKVQILDPASGTGTFLAEVIKLIYKKFEGQQGIWSNYVENHLLPRLNGFELLMASYAMAHLKLDLLLSDTGFKPTKDQRFRVFLTNSLEEYHPDTGTLWANWLSNEASEANRIKRETPVMCVIGNPPYRGESANKGKWIMNLMEDYKKEPGGEVRLKEKNPKWINDDYVKFIRYGQHYIERNGVGILAFINPHGFLDNPTFRGMRWNLLTTFDRIYTIDLHGNSNKREISPDGSADSNIFDIMQGVSINIFVKTSKQSTKKLGRVFHSGLFGPRESKYQFLKASTLSSIEFTELNPIAPYYFFVPKDFSNQNQYNKYFFINSLFEVWNSGVVSKRDKLNIHFSRDGVKTMINDILYLEETKCRQKYGIPDDVRDWNFDLARADIIETKQSDDCIQKINYRPFDKRYFYYSGKSKGIVGWPVPVVSDHLVHENNIGLMTNKKVEIGDFKHVIVYKGIVESHAISMKEINYVFPLYIYNNDGGQKGGSFSRRPNFKKDIVSIFAKELGLIFTDEKEPTENTFAPIDILDYIYAVLSSPTYREKYKEFLKTDFPRVPYPKDKEIFWQLVKLGEELRLIHLLENPLVNKLITQYPKEGDNIVEKFKYSSGKVLINENQHFDNVPEIAWNFFIGGYQPAQKWLKDRKGRKLEFEDILHYQKIIVALVETDRIMKEIDKIDFE